MSESASREAGATAPALVTIDGPAGSGKSTVARRVAQLLGYTYLNTGAMYRAVALEALRRATPLDAPEALARLAEQAKIEWRGTPESPRVLLEGEDVSEQIQTAEVAQAASKVAAVPGVRRALVEAQRRMAGAGRMVLEGRDTGSHVIPGAALKIFLTASFEERARRRMKEQAARGEALAEEQVIAEMKQRDQRDREREASPLVRAADAVLVDNTAMDAEETARLIVMLARERQRPIGKATEGQAAPAAK